MERITRIARQLAPGPSGKRQYRRNPGERQAAMRKTVAALISAAATVTMITGAGVATAATSHPATSHPATTHQAAARPAVTQRAVTGTEHFQDVSASLTSNKSPVAAYGAFNAGGVDTQLGHRTDLFK